MPRSTTHWEDRVVRRLRLRDLRYLLAVAERGSMAKAATELGISQPAVSKALGELEHALGVRLLDRNPQGVEPTIYGRALVRRGRAIIDELKQGVEEIEFLADPTVGKVRIACLETFAAEFLPSIIGPFTRQYPRVELIVEQSNSITYDYRELRERRLDLMLGRVTLPFEEEPLSAEILFQDQGLVIAGADSEWARRRTVELADLLGEPWVRAPDHSALGARWAQRFAAHGLAPPQPRVATFSMHLIFYLVAREGFIGGIPGFMRHLGKRYAFKVLPIGGIEPSPMALVTLKNRTPSPATQRFIECIRAAAKPRRR